MATADLSVASKENTNFCRLCRLLIDENTQVFREVFDKTHQPSLLKSHLLKSKNHKILKNLKHRRILKKEQWDKLYPARGSVTSTEQYSWNELDAHLTEALKETRKEIIKRLDEMKEVQRKEAKETQSQKTTKIDESIEKLDESIRKQVAKLRKETRKEIIERLDEMKEVQRKEAKETQSQKTTKIHESIEKLNELIRKQVAKLCDGEQTKKDRTMLCDSEGRPSVPEEIKARGPKAIDAYHKALKDGKVEVFRGRIMLVGQERAGKTSLRKSLLGLPFNPEEESTVGVKVDPSCCRVDVDNVKNWQRIEATHVVSDFSNDVAKIVAKKLNQEKEEGHFPVLDDHTIEQSTGRSKDPKQDKEHELEDATDAEKGNKILENEELRTNPQAQQQVEQEKADDKDEHLKINDLTQLESSASKLPTEKTTNIEPEDGIPEDVANKLIQYLQNKDVDLDSSSKSETVISIWDFAGQHLYYAAHSVFLSPKAVYLLVYDLSQDLNAEAKPCVRQGALDTHLENVDGQTNIEALLSWLVSIHSARPKDKKTTRKDPPYQQPPVIIVGTKADQSFKDPKDTAKLIQKNLLGKHYGKHLIKPFFAVENSMPSSDERMQKLQEKIKEVFDMEPYMGEAIPVRWLRFEKAIKALHEENTNNLKIEELEKIIRKICFIDDADEIKVMLDFFHDLGVIVKHGDTVVLDTQWLLDLFRKVITVRPYNDTNPMFEECWIELEERGILRMKLIDHVLSDLPDSGASKQDLLGMMEHYGLIAAFNSAHDVDEVRYFVPAQLTSSPKELRDIQPSPTGPCALYMEFKGGFVPHGLYVVLVSKLIAWCSQNGGGPEPKLFRNASCYFVVGMSFKYRLVLICCQRYIKVILNNVDASNSCSYEPAVSIRIFIESTLQEISEERHWYRSLCYKLSVLCSSCFQKQCKKHKAEKCHSNDCLHLLEIKENRQLMICEHNLVNDTCPNIERLDYWYNTQEEQASTCSDKDKLSRLNALSQGALGILNLGDEQKRWLVVGIGLIVTLIPPLRTFIEPEIEKHYNDFKTSHNIDHQAYPKQVKKDNTVQFNYGSINDNEAIHKKRYQSYDYKVQSAVDFAKLYLKPFMAKFSAIDDNCDASAVLGMLSSASVFSTTIQEESRKVRQDVRNEWGHCNFNSWTQPKFEKSFELMESLLKALKLDSTLENGVTGELNYWKSTGIQLCESTAENKDLVKILDAVSQLKEVYRRLDQYDEDIQRVNNTLESIQEILNNVVKGLNDVTQRVDEHDQKLTTLKRRVDEIDYSMKNEKKEALVRVNDGKQSPDIQ